jgi:hypothetical protein
MALTREKTKLGIVTGVPEKDFTLFKGVPYTAPPWESCA